MWVPIAAGEDGCSGGFQTRHWPRQLKGLSASSYQFVLIHGCHGAVMFSTGLAQGRNRAGLKSLFHR